MSISVFAHVEETTEVSVNLQESQAGKFCAFSAGDLTVLINTREKALEIASLLESAEQKWEDEA